MFMMVAKRGVGYMVQDFKSLAKRQSCEGYWPSFRAFRGRYPTIAKGGRGNR